MERRLQPLRPSLFVRAILTVTVRLAVCASLLTGAYPAFAATYYIDFDAGADANAGTTSSWAFKHCPGDPEAGGSAAGVKLQPGDVVIFKGGVAYRGMVNVTASGDNERPITFDGNSAGSFGTGKAIIEGAERLKGWKKCGSADEAAGNPLWADIYYVDVPPPKTWRGLNLCDAETALPIAQMPKPKDPFFQDDPTDYFRCPDPLATHVKNRIVPGPGLVVNDWRPLMAMLTKGAATSAVISPLKGGSFTVEMEKPQTIAEIGIAPQPNYSAPKEVVFSGDGKELMTMTLEKGKKEIQRFKLAAPVTMSKLTVKFLSAYDEENAKFGAISQVAAYSPDGTNVLEPEENATMSLTDPKGLTATDPTCYSGMMFGFHGGPNLIIYEPISSYDPAIHRLTVPSYMGNLYKSTQYAFFNSVRLISQTGEYSVEPVGDGRRSRVFLLPRKLEDGEPADTGVATRAAGIKLSAASNIVVEGLIFRRQNGTALKAEGPASNIVFRNCEVTLVCDPDGAAVNGVQITNILVEHCNVHHNPGHTRGIAFNDSNRTVVRDCQIVKNSWTGVDFYHCSDGQMLGNIVSQQRGIHANGLTLYLGCKNILVEGNRVDRGYTAMTFQQIENVIFRNNIFDSNTRSMVVGIWPTQPIKNVQFINNTIVRSDLSQDWATGLFTNSKAIEGLVVRNNIIDGICGDPLRAGTYSNNLYTRKTPLLADGMPGKNELFESDLKKIFVDPDHDDFHLKAGSPAIGAGMDVGLEKDLSGATIPRGKTPDIGAYQFEGK